jgi:hypothetical protein
MSAHSLLIVFCVSWIFLCGRMWWTMDRRNAWQRHAIALAAGLGAGAFYWIGSAYISVSGLKEKQAPEPTSEAVRVMPKP